MQHDGPVLEIGSLDPERDRERLEPVEVAKGKGHVVLTAYAKSFAHASLDHLRTLGDMTGTLRRGQVGDLAAVDGLEREITNQPGYRGL